MANIVINEISQNYTYNIGASSYATVALPITACWGPAYDNGTTPASAEVEDYKWTKFPATQEGLEAFVSTFRGPSSNYRLTKDFSYQMAMTLITAGYDVLVTRVCPGGKAFNNFTATTDTASYLNVTAKYPGTFGNNLRVQLKRLNYPGSSTKHYWNMIVFILDSAGGQTAVENKVFVLDAADSTDTIVYYEDVDSAFVDLSVVGTLTDNSTIMDFLGTTDTEITVNGTQSPIAIGTKSVTPTEGQVALYNSTYFQWKSKKWTAFDGTTSVDAVISLAGGADVASHTPVSPADPIADYNTVINNAYGFAKVRYNEGDWAKSYVSAIKELEIDFAVSTTEITAGGTQSPTIDGEVVTPTANMVVKYSTDYFIWTVIDNVGKWAAYTPVLNTTKAYNIEFNEWVYTAAWAAYGALTDKLSYNPNRVISPGWDDQDVNAILDAPDLTKKVDTISPLHAKLMDIAFYSRCATAYIDIPRSCTINQVYNESTDDATEGYAQRLARNTSSTALVATNGPLYQTNSALFAPWGQFVYTGTSKQNTASPSFMALMIQRAQILNQPAQYEWALPTNRKHTLKLGKLDYTISKKYLDQWQTLEGVGVNAITTIPDLGTNIWGNSTLYEVPPATYQALANLSTRLLVNAVEDVAYRCGVSITYQYNNAQAYDKFYAGVTPLLDTMKNLGAIEDYYVTMAADIDGLDSVNANTVIGKIFLTVNGVINDIYIDLIALPPSVDLDQFRS